MEETPFPDAIPDDKSVIKNLAKGTQKMSERAPKFVDKPSQRVFNSETGRY